MTAWTPKLEQLIRRLADAEESMLQDIINPESSRVGSTLRVTFNLAVKLEPLGRKVCKEMGLRPPYEDHMQQIIALAEKNDVYLANQLKRNVAINEQIDWIVDSTLNTRRPFKALKAIKRAGIKY